MTKRMLEVEVHREPEGLWAQVSELGGCFASGETFDELIRALEEAAAMCITGPATDDLRAPVENEDSAPDGMDDVSGSDTSELPRLLMRVVGLQIEVDYDLRPDNADDLTQPPARRKRQSHRDDWPPTDRSPHPHTH